MVVSKKEGFRIVVLVFSLTCLSGICLASSADKFGLELVGGRFGFAGESRTSTFDQAECFSDWALPCDWEFAENWHTHWRVDATAGWLGGHGEDAFVGSVGPTLVLNYDKWPVSLEGGVSPTYISRYEFGPSDLGSLLQFSSHGQLNWDIGEHIQISYRFQHMSNAGISSHNPGLNFHMFGIAYRF
jgi:hypothetical protein